ncbi:hypothetical protein [Allomuricauda sp. d1]|uniref:hypothetical protein n=1 Tax=Allomuricauda sp. d1 TaxID=3136725 RepID=UPI0031DC987A
MLKKTILLLGIAIFAFQNSNAQNYREFIALHELYQSTDGHNWKNSWDLNAPIETWEGVTVKDGHVVALDLSDNNLKGKIPATLVNLKYLIHLNLSGNALRGKLPGQLARLKKLAFFDVSENAIAGKIPNSIGKMAKLKSLQLSGNDFGDYSGLETIQQHQLVAFDMDQEFKYLELMDANAFGRMTDIKFEDSKNN